MSFSAIRCLRAQSATASVDSTRWADFRDPNKARVLGTVLPGAGHIYAGEYANGARYYLTAVSGIGGGYLVYLVNGCTFDFLNAGECHHGPDWPHQTLGILMMAYGAGTWVWSAIDAGRAAERHNKQAHWKALVAPGSRGTHQLLLGVERVF